MCGAELHTIRPVAQVFAMPWHAFNEGSGAWMLHPQDLHALDPVVLVDHFTMPTPTFAPHPHAGFSAVTYLFEDSEGGIRNRDSLGTTCEIEPGALHWTQAGRGMLHEELPSHTGRAAHGLQLFINSQSSNKNAEPAAFQLRAADIPAVTTLSGARVRVVQGEYAGEHSRVPSHTEVTLLDVQLPAGTSIDLPLPTGQRSFAIVVQGSLVTDHGEVAAHHALRFSDEGAVVQLLAGSSATQVVVLAGTPIAEAIVPRGPFIANTAEQAADMIQRFRSGEMGTLSPTSFT